MKTFYVNGNSCSQLEKAEHKLKQLKEAEHLLDDLSWKLSWALDFSEYDSINEQLNPPLEVIDNAHTDIQEQIETLEEVLENYKQEKLNLMEDYDNESELKYFLS